MNIRPPFIAFIISLILFLLSFTGCSGGGGSGDGVSQGTRVSNTSVFGCFLEDYSDAATSEYILPYQVGMSFVMNQGNCGQFTTHRPNCTAINAMGQTINCGDLRYSYDFAMPIGMIILAARGGTVTIIVDGFSNTTNAAGEENQISIEHTDGSVATYLHFSPNSLMVNLGDVVQQGDPIGLSGSSGSTDPGFSNPHLHFHVVIPPFTGCTAPVFSGCTTIPVTFSNANPLDAPLIEGNVYEALPF